MRRNGKGRWERAERIRLLLELLRADDRQMVVGWNFTRRARHICARYASGASAEQVGREFGVSKQRIYQVILKTLERYEENRTRIAVGTAYLTIRSLAP